MADGLNGLHGQLALPVVELELNQEHVYAHRLRTVVLPVAETRVSHRTVILIHAAMAVHSAQHVSCFLLQGNRVDYNL